MPLPPPFAEWKKKKKIEQTDGETDNVKTVCPHLHILSIMILKSSEHFFFQPKITGFFFWVFFFF